MGFKKSGPCCLPCTDLGFFFFFPPTAVSSEAVGAESLVRHSLRLARSRAGGLLLLAWELLHNTDAQAPGGLLHNYGASPTSDQLNQTPGNGSGVDWASGIFKAPQVLLMFRLCCNSSVYRISLTAR